MPVEEYTDVGLRILAADAMAVEQHAQWVIESAKLDLLNENGQIGRFGELGMSLCGGMGIARRSELISADILLVCVRWSATMICANHFHHFVR